MIPQTAESIATTVRGIRQESRNPIVLLEGHTDFLMFAQFFTHQSAYQHVVCDGKPKLISAAESLSTAGVKGVLPICDADYDIVLQRRLPAAVVVTDLHDSEMLVCSCDAFDRVLREHLYSTLGHDPALLERVRALAFLHSQRIGRVRIKNQEGSRQITFKDINAGTYVRSDWSFDEREYVAALVENSPRSTCTAGEIQSFMNEDVLREVKLVDLVNGHDLASIAGAYLSIPFSRPLLERETLEREMRLALSNDEFEGTCIYEQIVRWEREHDLEILR